MQPSIRWYLSRNQITLSELFRMAWRATRSYSHDTEEDADRYRAIGAVPPYVNEFLRSPEAQKRLMMVEPYW